MARPRTHGPTERELSILKVLWERGGSTLKEIQETIQKQRPVAYTTIQTIVQTMIGKGLAKRKEVHGSPLIYAAVTEDSTRRSTVRYIAEKLFGGSVTKLLQHALGTQRISSKDMEKLKQQINESERGK